MKTMFHTILQQFASLYDSWLIVIAPLFLVGGLVMVYYGLVVSRLVVWLVGFFWGALGGIAIGYLAGGELGAMAGCILLGSVVGSIFLWVAVSVPKVLGFLALYLSTILLVQPEGWEHIIPLTVGLIGGWLGGFLDRSFLIITSSMIGAWMTATATLSLYGRFDSGFHGDLFTVAHHYSFVWIGLYSMVIITGILKQYGVYSIYSGFDHYFAGMASSDDSLGALDSQLGKMLTYCLEKDELAAPSKVFAWTHALTSWIWVGGSLMSAILLLYVANAIDGMSSDDFFLGWAQLKAVLSLCLALYFATAIYVAIKALNNEPAPAWAVRVTFRWGIALSMGWLIVSLVPLTKGVPVYDSLLILFVIVPLVIQYRHDISEPDITQLKTCLES